MKVGDRIVLRHMPEDPNPVPVGSEGIITRIAGPFSHPKGPYLQYGVKWDNGRTLGMIVPPDVAEVIAEAPVEAKT